MPIRKGIPEAPLKIYAEKLYTMAELAGVLRCDLRSAYNYRLEGRFKYVAMGNKYLVSGAEILYLRKNGLRAVSASYRKKAAAIQRSQRARRAEAAGAKAVTAERATGGSKAAKTKAKAQRGVYP